MQKCFYLLIILVIVSLILCSAEGKKRKTKKYANKALILRQKETTPINFLRLAVMRLIYGIASRFGLGEQISTAFNGAFVPPGVDDYDDYGGEFDLLDRDEEYDY